MQQVIPFRLCDKICCTTSILVYQPPFISWLPNVKMVTPILLIYDSILNNSAFCMILSKLGLFNLFPPLWSLHWDWAHNTCLIWNGLSNYFHCCKIESNWVLCIRLRTLTKRGYYILSQPKCTKNITYQTVAVCSFFLLYCCQIRPTVCQLSTCGQCPLIRLESSLDIEQSAP